jgi:aldose 1-epimerase
VDGESIISERFGWDSAGREVLLFTLRNRRGMSVSISNYGATIVSALVADAQGTMADVVLGYDRLEGYIKGQRYFGGLIGRYANRIAGAGFSLDGTHYRLTANDGPNCLHGGDSAFHKSLWTIESAAVIVGIPTLRLNHTSPHGAGGFPGTLQVDATFTLSDDNSLRLDLSARTDRCTVINLTSHPYFNLTSDPGNCDITGHRLQVLADAYLPVDDQMMPTGEFRKVHDTPFDFRSLTGIGANVASADQQVVSAMDFDHNFVMRDQSGGLSLRAVVEEPTTGRTLHLLSTAPGLQFYTGNHLDGTDIGKAGVALKARSGFCLEPQHFPDAPNQPGFPSTVLTPESEYRSSSVYLFNTVMPARTQS